MYPVTQCGAHLTLREVGVDDVGALLAIYGSAEATRYLSFEPRTREQVGLIVARSMVSATAQPRTEYALAVCERGPDGPLVGFARLALGGQSAGEIGFALRPDRWGRGYGRELVSALVAFGFGPLELHRIWAARAPDNASSRAVLLGAGMEEEGRIRHHVQVRGAWRDSVVHSRVNDEAPPLP
ncbi:GNAT family N-acetyltransferase [Streptomyces avicenniae]|uniref:GNAT family N-acetyltransferase n=1 Tax=Streptomyces avicenniae TaxID=500153 RepID=UPI00069A2EBB|nr:GNAT family protein [Streptomyces avicenniae]